MMAAPLVDGARGQGQHRTFQAGAVPPNRARSRSFADTTLTDNPPRTGTDPAEITAALLRADKRAHEIALASVTKVIVVVDGKMVAMDPDPEMFDRADS